MKEKRLSDFLDQSIPFTIRGPRDVLISSLEYDSRKVAPGALFAAFPGLHQNGHRYIAQALSQGAKAILHSEELDQYDSNIAYIQSTDPRRLFSSLAASFYDYPSRQIPTIGVTGTDGKSSTVSFIHQLFILLGMPAGFLSTVAFQIGSALEKNALRQSTPEANQIHGYLREMADQGLSYAVLESTSHGLSPLTCRLEDVDYSVAVMTNVTQEHLEFHGSLEAYRQAKVRLFEALDRSQGPITPFGVVNADDPNHHLFMNGTKAPVLRYAIQEEKADLKALILEESPSGTDFELTWQGKSRRAFLPVPGVFNVENIMAALLAVSSVLNRSPLDLIPHLEMIQGIPGRMNPVREGQKFHVLVDYAHTPGSFSRIFPIVRKTTPGRLIAVFGSAGERDREKRPLQGKIACDFADYIILTDEDPRMEDSMSILEEIGKGCGSKEKNKNLFLIPNRQEGIKKAFSLAGPGDTVLLLGKGHEQSIEYRDHSLPWDDVQAARDLLRSGSWVDI